MELNDSIEEGIPRRFSKAGLFLVSLTGGAAVALSVVCLPFVSPALRRVCLPYVPATGTQVSNVLMALSGRQGRLVDLGSGDGRIVLSAAQAGFSADGIELNPWLVGYSRLQAYRLGLRSKANFYRQDLWKTNLAPYHNVVIFGVQEMMPELEEKLIQELREDTCVIACRFPFPSRTPDSVLGSGIDTVWKYNWKPS
ncbi:ATP synthase subunit C lysine N-methyltransferase [Anabrus simplex]|uniref:ATP synthase subunit C lysine N-methyltransferase n=1 Tax=Anabrus simplex TaxID=316456 RepID=UPI0034DD490B